MSPEGDVVLLFGGALVLALSFPLAILLPILWKKRLVIHLEVVGLDGRPASRVIVRGAYHRMGPAFQTTGEGMAVERALHGQIADLGRTDERGRFLRTLYVRNVHTLLVGGETLFVDVARPRMSKEAPYPVRLKERSGERSMRDLFEGKGES